MPIKQFTFDPALTDRFVRFGYEHYHGDVNWIPPLSTEVRGQLSPEFTFYGKPGNSHRHFLATSGGRAVGRITAMVNGDLKDRDSTPVGTVGFFECIEAYGVAEALVDAATRWLRSQHGLTRVWGPMNFDIWHGYRFMTQGFDQNLFYGEPYNKPYYPEFFNRYGFTIKDSWDSVEVSGRDTLRNMITRGEKRYRMLVDRGYRFESIDMSNWQDEMRKLHSVMLSSFGGFLGYTPLSPVELDRMLFKSKYAIDPELFVFAYDETNTLAGFAAAFLELADAVRAMKGKSGPLAKLRFLRDRRHVDRINFYIGGVTPEELSRRSGLGRAGFYYTINQMLNKGYETLLLTLRLKGNSAHGLAARCPLAPQREYALYELTL
jgi:hypothetical protein